VVIADVCDKQGLKLPRLAPETVREMEALAPKYAAFGNPVDLTAQVTGDHERVNQVCAQLLADPHVDQLIVRYGSVQGAKGETWARGLAAVAEHSDKPLLIAWSRVPDRAEVSMRILEESRIPWLLTPTRAANAAGALYQFAHKRERMLARGVRALSRHIEPRALELPAGAGALSEHESKRCLSAYGIRVTREVLIAPAAVADLQRSPLPFPLAVKVDSADIAHKTEAGAVRLNVQSVAELKRAVDEVLAAARKYKRQARINGILLSEMVKGQEVIIGAVNDRFFGPVVMFGLGGVFTELLEDVVYRFAPFDIATAHDMIRAIRGHPLLTGYRGRAPLALDALAETLVRVSLLAADHADRISTLDINPLFVNDTAVVAADALIVLGTRPEITSGKHNAPFNI
jgi:acetyltransferase